MLKQSVVQRINNTQLDNHKDLVTSIDATKNKNDAKQDSLDLECYCNLTQSHDTIVRQQTGEDTSKKRVGSSKVVEFFCSEPYTRETSPRFKALSNRNPADPKTKRSILSRVGTNTPPEDDGIVSPLLS